MAKVYIENVRDLVEKAGEIREKLALATAASATSTSAARCPRPT